MADERWTPEEIELIIRQHNAARVKPSRTELALLEAQLAKADKAHQEELYNRTMEAKKSGWDDCEKWHREARSPDRENLKQILIDNLLIPCAGQGRKAYEYTANKVAGQLLSVLNPEANPDYDPQVEEFSWYIEHGWIPPGEVERLKEAIRKEVAEEIFGELDQWNGTITKDTPSEAFPNMVTTKSLRVLTNRLKSRLGGGE